MDALILTALLEAGCKEIYTTDSHFELYKKEGVEIINLNKITELEPKRTLSLESV
jgi:predicted nucleic acid-binding protein